MNQPLPASIAAGAAFSVGFGATKRLLHDRASTKILTSLGMTTVAFIGTVAGRDPMIAWLATTIMGAVCGLLSLRNGDFWWAWLQIVIAFLLAVTFPGDAAAGLHRAGLVAFGAAVQCGAVWGATRLFGEPPVIVPATVGSASDTERGWYALRAAVCIAIAVGASRAAGLAHGYWAPMTAMLILKPGLRETWWRGLERIGGTILGIALATGLVTVCKPVPTFLVGAAVLAAGAAYGLQQARYALLSGAITTSVKLMIALAGGQVIATDADRLLATLLGGVVALAGAAIVPRRPLWRRDVHDHA